MVSFMTLQNSMDKRKFKKFQTFDHTLPLWVCGVLSVSEGVGERQKERERG